MSFPSDSARIMLGEDVSVSPNVEVGDIIIDSGKVEDIDVGVAVIDIDADGNIVGLS